MCLFTRSGSLLVRAGATARSPARTAFVHPAPRCGEAYGNSPGGRCNQVPLGRRGSISMCAGDGIPLPRVCEPQCLVLDLEAKLIPSIEGRPAWRCSAPQHARSNAAYSLRRSRGLVQAAHHCRGWRRTRLHARAGTSLCADTDEGAIRPDHTNPTGGQTYGYFGYGKRQPSLTAMAGSASVIYLGSFSKTIYPGLRIGFMTANQVIEGTLPEIRLSDVVSKIKSFLTVNSCQLSQAIVGGLLVKHHYLLKAFVAPRVKEMKKNRDAMVSALQEYFPRDEPWTSGIGWNSPTGGYFLTLKVPFEVSEKDLLGVAPEKRTP